MKRTLLALALIILFLPGCSAGPIENASTRTARAERNWLLATQIASDRQKTAQIQNRQATGTAVTQKELATQVWYDENATSTAEIKQNTAVAAQTTATAQSIRRWLQSAQDWPPALVDSFDQASPAWSIGEKTGRIADLNWTIAGGKYRWEVRPKGEGVYWVDPELPPTSDFYLSVETRQISGSPDVEAGLVFRAYEDSFWCFLVDNQSQAFFGLLVRGEWKTSFPLGTSSIRPGGTNHLAVIAQGAQVVFFINGEDILSVSDGSLLDGLAGLMVLFSEVNDPAVWEFDNFELRLPPGESLQTPTAP